MKRHYGLAALTLLGLSTAVCAAQQCPSGQHLDAAGACVASHRKSNAPSKNDMTANWPGDSRSAADAFEEKYGKPDVSSPRLLAWNDRGDWSKVSIYRESTIDPVPTPHPTFIENQVRYVVPAFRVRDLENFDKSLVIDTHDGTLASRSDSERSNILALNLANDIVTGKKTVAQAQDERARIESLNVAGKTTPISERLNFTPDQPGKPAKVRAVERY